MTDQPEPNPNECPICRKVWASATVAQDCCGDWLGYD